MSNTRRPHPFGPEAARMRDQEIGNQFLDALPPQVRPHKVPMLFAVGVEEGPGGNQLAINVFHAMGITALRFSAEEWEQFKAQGDAQLPQVRSGLVVPTVGPSEPLVRTPDGS